MGTRAEQASLSLLGPTRVPELWLVGGAQWGEAPGSRQWRPGSAAWECASRTGSLVKSAHPGVVPASGPPGGKLLPFKHPVFQDRAEQNWAGMAWERNQGLRIQLSQSCSLSLKVRAGTGLCLCLKAISSQYPACLRALGNSAHPSPDTRLLTSLSLRWIGGFRLDLPCSEASGVSHLFLCGGGRWVCVWGGESSQLLSSVVWI